MQNAVLKNEMVEWNLKDWDYIVDETARLYNLSQQEKERLYNSRTARIIATIPYAAKCDFPERTAIAHIMLYEAEKKGFQKFCAHFPEDDSDIYRRLALISTFEGGNPKIIEYGMNMLAMIMIEGYHKSEENDAKTGTYNPFVSGVWNYQELKKMLLKKMDGFCNPLLDGVYYRDYGYGW